MFYWAAMFLVASGYNCRGSAEDIVAEELGVKIEKVGDTSAARYKIFISMVVKLPDAGRSDSRTS